MEQYEILKIAANQDFNSIRNLSSLNSSFGLIKSLIDTSYLSKTRTEEERKEMITKNLQNLFIDKKSKKISGCDKTDVQNIVKTIFGIRSSDDPIKNSNFDRLTLHEWFLYFCYIERLVKIEPTLKSEIVSEMKSWNKLKGTIEKNKIEEEKKKILEMDSTEKIRYEIFNGRDMEYYAELETSDEESILIANTLKEYWEQQGKWEGAKVSKKQVTKIIKVKSILGLE